MTILITGGTGNTGLCLAKRLREANHSVLLTSHSRPVPEPFEGVRFDWLDTSTHENPFNAAHDIDSLYIICPQVYDMLGATRPFLDLAVAKGVKRFVLMSGTAMVKGSEAMGKVHEYIVALGVDYCILRPTGFIELFGTHFLRGIRDENYIASAAKDGRIPLIGVDDIVDVAFDALVDEESHNTEHIIVGPELFSYDEVAALFSEILGRRIVHKRLDDPECVDVYLAYGIDKALAEVLLGTEQFMAQGGEEVLFYGETKVVGRRHLVDYINSHLKLWQSE